MFDETLAIEILDEFNSIQSEQMLVALCDTFPDIQQKLVGCCRCFFNIFLLISGNEHIKSIHTNNISIQLQALLPNNP